MENLLKEIVNFKGLGENFVYLRKDENGKLYLEYAFIEGYPENNDCLSQYVKGQEDDGFINQKEVDKIYSLSAFTCGNEHQEDPDRVCKPGQRPKNCAFWEHGGYDCGWTYENPVKCACWDLEKVNFGTQSFPFTEKEMKEFIEKMKNL